MITLREAAQQALEALEERYVGALRDKAMDALKAALEQHEKDVEWMKQRHANWRLQKELAEQTQERDRQQREYEESRSAALAEPEQEPVAWACIKNGELQTELVGTEADVDFWCASDEPEMEGMVKGTLYTHPPRREWRGLTEEEIGRVAGDTLDAWSCARAIEAALKEKNHE